MQANIKTKPVGDVARDAASFAAYRGRCLHGTSRAADRHSHRVAQTLPDNNGYL